MRRTVAVQDDAARTLRLRKAQEDYQLEDEAAGTGQQANSLLLLQRESKLKAGQRALGGAEASVDAAGGRAAAKPAGGGDVREVQPCVACLRLDRTWEWGLLRSRYMRRQGMPQLCVSCMGATWIVCRAQVDDRCPCRLSGLLSWHCFCITRFRQPSSPIAEICQPQREIECHVALARTARPRPLRRSQRRTRRRARSGRPPRRCGSSARRLRWLWRTASSSAPCLRSIPMPEILTTGDRHCP